MNDLIKYFNQDDIAEILFQEGYNQFRVNLTVEYVPGHGNSDFSERTLAVAYKGSYEEFAIEVRLNQRYLLSEFNAIAHKYGDYSVASRIIAERFLKVIKDPKLVGANE